MLYEESTGKLDFNNKYLIKQRGDTNQYKQPRGSLPHSWPSLVDVKYLLWAHLLLNVGCISTPLMNDNRKHLIIFPPYVSDEKQSKKVEHIVERCMDLFSLHFTYKFMEV